MTPSVSGGRGYVLRFREGNKQSLRVWGFEHPRATAERNADSPKLIICSVACRTIVWSELRGCAGKFVYQQLQELQPAVFLERHTGAWLCARLLIGICQTD